MPKIRQAIALLVAVGGCIAFNTLRYPVVREMAAAISAMGPSASAKAGENPSLSAKDARHASSTEKPAKAPPAGVVCKDGVCTFASSDSATASIPSSHFGDSPADDATASESWPTEGSDGNLSGRGESKSAGDESRRSPQESASGPRESETAATPDGRSEGVAGTGTIAKFVSALVDGKSPAKEPGDSSLGETSLVPIQRPKSRPQKKTNASTTVSSSVGVKSSAEPSATDKTVRHLPPVGLASTADFLAEPPTLSPERIRDYAVTPVK